MVAPPPFRLTQTDSGGSGGGGDVQTAHSLFSYPHDDALPIIFKHLHVPLQVSKPGRKYQDDWTRGNLSVLEPCLPRNAGTAL
jgi:hypothetical protein